MKILALAPTWINARYGQEKFASEHCRWTYQIFNCNFKAPAQPKTESTEPEGPAKEKKKSRGKKNKQKENVVVHEAAAMGFQPQETSLDFGGLQIISKAEWKKLRNTYLNLQRKNMGQVKKSHP